MELHVTFDNVKKLYEPPSTIHQVFTNNPKHNHEKKRAITISYPIFITLHIIFNLLRSRSCLIRKTSSSNLSANSPGSQGSISGCLPESYVINVRYSTSEKDMGGEGEREIAKSSSV